LMRREVELDEAGAVGSSLDRGFAGVASHRQ
jgi:hypothetical protein